MITYREGFVARKLHKSGNYVDGLFAVTVRQAVVDGVKRHLFPHAVFLDVTGTFNVEIYLAEVKELKLMLEQDVVRKLDQLLRKNNV